MNGWWDLRDELLDEYILQVGWMNCMLCLFNEGFGVLHEQLVGLIGQIVCWFGQMNDWIRLDWFSRMIGGRVDGINNWIDLTGWLI